MSSPIISVEGLGKEYVIGGRERGSETFREMLTSSLGVPFKRLRQFSGAPATEEERFWALKDVSFDVKEGEVVGIIGRNGAGKSTLLKILSRIAEPTEGRITVRGRVASLLEVGTGFHPELTGRENIFLNGAILGMSRAEIYRKFDEIVAFAEIEKFLDTPVKRYSSGMYVRLAFAVAAHLDPEILVVDEVLAVGDVDFQKKCLGKMRHVSAHDGRTVILVSHNLGVVSELATRVVLLASGRVVAEGSPSSVIARYLSGRQQRATYEAPALVGERMPFVQRVEVVTSHPNDVHEFAAPLEIRFWINHEHSLKKGCFSFQVVNQFGVPVLHAFNYYTDIRFGTTSGSTMLVCSFPAPRLNVGDYTLKTNLSEAPGERFYEHLEGICTFTIIRTDQNVLWGWRPQVCTYHDDWSWTVKKLREEQSETLTPSKASLLETSER